MVVENRNSLKLTKKKKKKLLYNYIWAGSGARRLLGTKAGFTLHFSQRLQGSLHLSAPAPFISCSQFAILLIVPIL